MDDAPVLFDVQKYSIHDGDCIRTTLFFKGCPLRCGWCHNPESQLARPQLMWHREKCTGCGMCIQACAQKAIGRDAQGQITLDREKCTAWGQCAEWCVAGAREVAGRTYPIDELLAEAEKDQMFHEESGGGVTLSGGEVMAAQPFSYVVELARRLHSHGISVFIDTCGFAPWAHFEAILPYADTFLYDIKAMDPEKHRRWTGQDNTQILENLRRLSAAGARIYLRLPLIGGINDSRADIDRIADLLDSGVRVYQINLLPYHNTGQSKYDRLGRPYDTEKLFEIPARSHMEEIAGWFQQRGYLNVKIGG